MEFIWTLQLHDAPITPRSGSHAAAYGTPSNPAWAPHSVIQPFAACQNVRWADMPKAFAACIHYQVATPPDWPQATTAAKQTYNQALAVSGTECELDGAGGQLLLCRQEQHAPHVATGTA